MQILKSKKYNKSGFYNKKLNLQCYNPTNNINQFLVQQLYDQTIYQLYKQLFMNKYSQLKIISFFQEIIECEQVLNQYRKSLVTTRNYNPNMLFDLIAEEKNKITIQNFQNYLAHQEITATHRDLYQLFAKFDLSKLGYITRTDFIKALLPKDQVCSIPKAQGKSLPEEIEYKFNDLITIMIQKSQLIEICRNELEGILIYELFEEIDLNKTGYLGKLQLLYFFEKNEVSLNQADINSLIDALKRKTYIHINLEVLDQFMKPQESQYYQIFQKQLKILENKRNIKSSKNEEQKIKEIRMRKLELANEEKKKERRLLVQMKKLQNESESLQQINKKQSSNSNETRKLEHQYEKQLKKQQKISNNAKKYNINNPIYETFQPQTSKENNRNQLNIGADKKYNNNNQYYSNQCTNNRKLEEQLQIQKMHIKREKQKMEFYQRMKQEEIFKQKLAIERQLQLERNSIRQQMNLEKINAENKLFNRFDYPIQKTILRDEETELAFMEQQLQRKRKKMQIEKELEKTRIELVVRKNKIEMEAKLRGYQQYKKKNLTLAGIY